MFINNNKIIYSRAEYLLEVAKDAASYLLAIRISDEFRNTGRLDLSRQLDKSMSEIISKQKNSESTENKSRLKKASQVYATSRQ